VQVLESWEDEEDTVEMQVGCVNCEMQENKISSQRGRRGSREGINAKTKGDGIK
jgi:G3E family GTPase